MKIMVIVLVGFYLAGCAGRVSSSSGSGVLHTNSSIDVCFSPRESCDKKLVEFIRSAEQSLDIAIFDITHPQIVHEILVVSKKVPVRIVVDRRQSREPHSLVSTLLRAGAEVKMGRQRGIMHHKFIILDDRAVETGSFNFTNNASFKNQENQVYLNDPVAVDRFKKQFEGMWNEARVP